MNRAVFLDRDGTINVEKNYLHKIEDFEFLPGAVDALKQLQLAGYKLIIITNQSGIARGYYSEEDFRKLNTWMLSSLKNKGIEITAVYYCPHLPDAKDTIYRKNCNCRKPKLGMYKKAIKDYDIDLSKSYAVGDKIRDCAICEQSECKGYLVGHNEDAVIISEVKAGKRQNIGYAESLLECANHIINNSIKFL